MNRHARIGALTAAALLLGAGGAAAEGAYQLAAVGRSRVDADCRAFQACTQGGADACRLAAGWRFERLALQAQWLDRGRV